MVKLIISVLGDVKDRKTYESYHSCFPVFTKGEIITVEHKGENFVYEVKYIQKKIVQSNNDEETTIVLTVEVEHLVSF